MIDCDKPTAFFTRFLVLLAQNRLSRVVKTRLTARAAILCTAVINKTVKYVTSQAFSALHWLNVVSPAELKFEVIKKLS